MAVKKAKEQLRQEPLLSTVARKLGQAAGTVTNLTHGLLAHGSAEDSSATVATTDRGAGNRGTNQRANQGANQRTTAKPAVTRSVPNPKKKSRRAAGTTGKSKRAVAKRKHSHG
jgi:hypothetical protein